MTQRSAHRLGDFLARWVRLATRWAVPITILSLVAGGLACAYALANVRIDTDRDKMISGQLAFKRQQARLQALFPQFHDNLVLVIDAPTPEAARRAALDVAGELRALPGAFQRVYVPRADPFLERHGLLYLGVDELQELTDRLAEVQPFLGRLGRDPSARGLFEMLESAYAARAEGREVPLGATPARMAESIAAGARGELRELSWQELMRQRELGPEDRRQYVLAQPVVDYGRLFPARPALEHVRGARERLGLAARGVELRVTGGLAMSHEELLSVMSGAELIAGAVLVMVGLVLFVAMRSPRLVACLLVTLLVGLFFTSAFAIGVVGHLNMISVAFAALYVGLAVDYGIHFALRYRELVGGGSENAAALTGAARDVGGSLVLCSLTTALGFYSFVPTAYAGVSELGLISGTGMFVSLVVTLTLLPALLTIWPLHAPRPAPATFTGSGLVDLPVLRSREVSWTAMLLGLGSIGLVSFLRFDPNPLNLRDPESESVATFRDLLATSSTPPWSLAVLAADEREEAASRRRLAELPGVEKAISVASFVPPDQDEKLALLEEAGFLLGPELVDAPPGPAPDDEQRLAAARALVAGLDQWLASPEGTEDPGARALRAAVHGLVEDATSASADARRTLMARVEGNLLATLPENLERLSASLDAEAIRLADLPPEQRERWVAADGTRRVVAFPAGNLDDLAEMRRFAEEVRRVAPDAVGSPVTMIESGDAVVRAFRQAMCIAMVAVGLVVLVVLRRPLDVLLVLTPLVLASLLTGGTMVLFGIEFNFANVIALPLLLGIGVDNGIHMVHRARTGLSVDANPLRTSTARGVVFSSLTTFVSFFNLSFSQHPGTASMGRVLAIGVTWTLICTLVFLPALLRQVTLREARGARGPAAQSGREARRDPGAR